MQQLLIPIMRTERHHGDIDFEVVDFVNHAILFIDAAGPSLFKDKMLQVFNLTRASTRMFLQLQQQVGNFMEGSLVAALLDDGEFFL